MHKSCKVYNHVKLQRSCVQGDRCDNHNIFKEVHCLEQYSLCVCLCKQLYTRFRLDQWLSQ